MPSWSYSIFLSFTMRSFPPCPPTQLSKTRCLRSYNELSPLNYPNGFLFPIKNSIFALNSLSVQDGF